MRLRLTHFGVAIVAAMLLSPAAHAFTFEGGENKDNNYAPKFDVEEQSRQFRSGSNLDSAWGNKRDVETPFGKGSLQFGVQPGGSLYGSGFNSRFSPRDMDRITAPPGLQHRFDK